MKKLLTIATALLIMGFSQTSMAEGKRQIKPWHKAEKITCKKCHQGKKSDVNLKCDKCHGTMEEMKEETAYLGKKNPHTSIHFGETMKCDECHKEHRDPYLYCAQCHRTWGMAIPGTPEYDEREKMKKEEK